MYFSKNRKLFGQSFLKGFGLQKRFYNLKEEIKIPEFENKTNWNEKTSLEEIIHKIYKEEKKEEFIDIAVKLLKKNRLKTVKDWKKLTNRDKDRFPTGLVITLDEIFQEKVKNTFEEIFEKLNRMKKDLNISNSSILLNDTYGKSFKFVRNDNTFQQILENTLVRLSEARYPRDPILYIAAAPGIGKSRICFEILDQLKIEFEKYSHQKGDKQEVKLFGEYLKNPIYIPISFNGITQICDYEEIDFNSYRSIISRILYHFFKPNMEFSNFYKYLYIDQKYDTSLIELLDHLAKDKKPLIILIIDGYNRILNSSFKKDPKECLKSIVISIEYLIGIRNNFFILPLFSGTVNQPFKNMFGGSFSPCFKINVSLLNYSDVMKIIDEISKTNKFIEKNKERYNFKKLLSFVGGHARSLELFLEGLKVYDENTDLDNVFESIFSYTVNEINDYYDLTSVKDSTFIIAYYLSRVEIDSVEIGNHNFDHLQEIGLLFLNETKPHEFTVELTYIWFKELIKTCKNEKLKEICNYLCQIYEKDFNGYDFQIFNYYFVTARLISLEIIQKREIYLLDIFKGAYISEDISKLKINIQEMNFDCIRLKIKHEGIDKSFIDNQNRKEIEIKEIKQKGNIYDDVFFDFGIEEIIEQDKYTINPKESISKDSYEIEEKKVRNGNPKSQFFYVTNHTFDLTPFNENAIIVNYDYLKSFYGEAFATKFLITTGNYLIYLKLEKINLNKVENRNDLLKIPRIGEVTATKIIENKIKNLDELIKMDPKLKEYKDILSQYFE